MTLRRAVDPAGFAAGTAEFEIGRCSLGVGARSLICQLPVLWLLEVIFGPKPIRIKRRGASMMMMVQVETMKK